eukprot:1159867-Pelagomonas_calceolata.AAC.13
MEKGVSKQAHTVYRGGPEEGQPRGLHFHRRQRHLHAQKAESEVHPKARALAAQDDFEYGIKGMNFGAPGCVPRH